jgi:hypothetical protein
MFKNHSPRTGWRVIGDARDGPVEAGIALALALACVLVVIAPPLRQDISYAPWSDTVWVSGPLFCEASRQVAAGHLPLLNWTTFDTFHHNAHFTPVYPFFLLGILDFCNVAATVQSQDVIRFLHLLILFANGVVLARVVGLSWFASAFAATVLTTSLNTRELAEFPTIISCAAWLPLALAGLVLILDQRSRLRGPAALVGAVTLLLYAGPGSNMIACLVFLCLLVTGWWIVSTAAKEGVRTVIEPLAVLAACGALVLLLNVGSTINLLLHMEQMIRWTRTGPIIGSTTPKDLAEILYEQRSPSAVLSVFLPESREAYAAGAFFTTAPVLVLALVGALGFRRSAAVQALALVAALALGFMFFDVAGLARVLAFVPGLSHVRHLSLLGTPLSISLAVLSGFGFVAVTQVRTPGQLSLASTGALVTGACLLVGIAAGWGQTHRHPFGALAALGALALLVLIAWKPFARWAVPAGLAVLPLSVAAVFWHPLAYLPTVTDASLRSPTWKAVEEALDRIRAVAPQPGRIVIDGSLKGDELEYTSAGSIATYKGLPTFQFYLSPGIYWKFAKENYRFPDYKFYGLRGGDWVLAGADLTDPALRPQFIVGNVRVFRILDARPWVGAVCVAPTLAAEAGPGQPGRLPDPPSALAQAVTERWAAQAPDCAGGAVSDIAFQPDQNQIAWTTAPGAPRYLVINVPPYLSWRLDVGGAPAPLFNLGDTQILAVLPDGAAGRSRLTYVPRFYLARLAFSGGIAILALAAAALMLRRRTVERLRLEQLRLDG